MEDNVDKCLAFCQALVASNHHFTFALNIGKDTFSFSTYNQPRKGSACMGRDLKKAATRQQRRRERRAADPAVKQKAADHCAAAAAEKAAAEQAAAQPEMGGAAGPARTAAEQAKREPCCRRCKQTVASHPGGAKGCGASCTNLALTPEKLRQASGQGDLHLATPGKGGREEKCENCNNVMTPEHQCEETHEAAKLAPVKCTALRSADCTSGCPGFGCDGCYICGSPL
jgi:hypothetical protein